MKKIYISFYIIIGILFGLWNESMDNNHLRQNDIKNGFGEVLLLASIWPLSLPIAMVTLTTHDNSRWLLDCHEK